MATPQTAFPEDVKERDGIESLKDAESSQDEPSKQFTARTLRRVDLRVLPLLIAVYALSLIDRTNLGFARIAGMEKDLKLAIGDRFSIVSVVYFPTYIILELPSNLVLRRIGPRIWLSFITVAWGLVQLGEGFVPTWGWLAFCRVLLGAGEAGFFPAITYIISTWYTRYEVQKRLAAFYLSASLISGFSSILAYGLNELKGKRGLNGWQWIFIIEGAITILLGILVYFFVTDFPDKNTFLTPKQTALVLKRVEEDRGDSMPDEVTFKKVTSHLMDWKLWIYGLMFMTQACPAYFVGFFLPIILKAMGWKTRDALLLTAPPYAVALVFAMFFAWLSDKTRLRAPFLFILTLVTITGLTITAYHKNADIRYLGLFLVASGCSGSIPGVLAYSSNNVISQSKRAVSSAIIIAFGGVGGIIAVTTFRQKDFPRYFTGLWVTIGFQFFQLGMLVFMTLYFTRKNKRVREGIDGPIEGRPNFYYTI